MSILNLPAQFFKLYKFLNTKKYNVSVQTIMPFSFIPFLTKHQEQRPSLNDIIEQADALFEENKYLDVYKLLQQYKNEQNVNIQWRISRTLYKLARNQDDKVAYKQMLEEAYNLISECLESNSNVAEVHKWTAILCEAKILNEKRLPTLTETLNMKAHLVEANRLNPNDYTVLYLLGHWCYKMSSLTWFQRKLAKLIYWEPPTSTYDEALTYFLQAEELKPRYYISNLYMLGKINYEIGNMYRAHYYLKIAAEMTPTTDHECEYVLLAQKLAKKLKDFDISEEAL